MSLFGSTYKPFERQGSSSRRYELDRFRFQPHFRASSGRAKPQVNAPPRRTEQNHGYDSPVIRYARAARHPNGQYVQSPAGYSRYNFRRGKNIASNNRPPPPVPLRIFNLPNETIQHILGMVVGFCTLRRDSAARIRQLPIDTDQRFHAVNALPCVANTTTPQECAQMGAITHADRAKYVLFRRQLVRNASFWRAHWPAIEQQWLRNFPMHIIEFDAFIRETEAGRRRDVESVSLALYPRVDVLHDPDNEVNDLIQKGFKYAHDQSFVVSTGYAAAWSALIQRLPPWVKQVKLAASYLPRSLNPPGTPGGNRLRDWDNEFVWSREVRNGVDRGGVLLNNARAQLRSPASHVENVDIILDANGAPDAPLAILREYYDSYAWV